MLTKAQKLAAKRLLRKRPEVFPGTRAILDAVAAKAWFDKVYERMCAIGDVKDSAYVKEFCDAAGVPD